MQGEMPATRVYSPLARTLHWITVIAVFAMIPVGLVIDIEVGRFQKRICAKVVVPIGITSRVTDDLALPRLQSELAHDQ